MVAREEFSKIFQLQSRNHFQNVMILHKTDITELAASTGEIWLVFLQEWGDWMGFLV